MLCDDGSIRVMDFGIAKAVGLRRLTFTGFSAAMGTPDYMAPEQVKGKRGDARTDIYSLGAMLYEMLTGSTPFEGVNPYAIMNARLIGDPVAPRKLNAGNLAGGRGDRPARHGAKTLRPLSHGHRHADRVAGPGERAGHGPLPAAAPARAMAGRLADREADPPGRAAADRRLRDLVPDLPTPLAPLVVFGPSSSRSDVDLPIT